MLNNIKKIFTKYLFVNVKICQMMILITYLLYVTFDDQLIIYHTFYDVQVPQICVGAAYILVHS